MDDIVKTSGVSKGGIYTYFKSKDDIFKAIADNVLIQRKSIIENLAEEKSNTEKLKKYISTIIKNYNTIEAKKRTRFSFEFWIENKDRENVGNVTKKEYFNKRFNAAYKDVNEIIKAGQLNGEFRKDINIKSFIHILFASIDGMAFYNGILEKKTPRDGAELMSNLFNNYLLESK